MIWYFDDKECTVFLWFGSTIKASDGNIYKRKAKNEDLEQVGLGEAKKKKEEKQKNIISKYSISDQLNMMRGFLVWEVTEKELGEMHNHIEGVLGS